jgi:hypothetical protein
MLNSSKHTLTNFMDKSKQHFLFTMTRMTIFRLRRRIHCPQDPILQSHHHRQIRRNHCEGGWRGENDGCAIVGREVGSV